MNQNKPLLIGFYEGVNVIGIQLAFQNLINELTKRNHQFRIVNLGSSLKAHRVGSFSVYRSIEILTAVFQSWVYIPSCNPVYITVALSLLGFFRDLFILLPAFILHKKTIIHVHSGGYGEFYKQQHPVLQKLIKYTISKVDVIIILSESLKDQFFFLDDDSKCVVVLNMVDPLLLKDEPVDKWFGPPQPVQLLYLSNLMVDKGYLELLEACRILKENGQVNFECTFCGEFIEFASETGHGDDDIEVQKEIFFSKIKQYKLDGYVKYLGVVKGDAKIKILQSSHLFILPTRYPWEGQPASILEAMIYGMPVISTNFRAIPDIVKDGKNGFLVDTPSPEIIASHIRDLWEKPQKYQDMSTQAKEMFWNMYTPEVQMETLIHILYGKPAVDMAL